MLHIGSLRNGLRTAFLIFGFTLVSFAQTNQHALSIIPRPAVLTFTGDQVDFSHGLRLVNTTDSDATSVAAYLDRKLRATNISSIDTSSATEGIDRKMKLSFVRRSSAAGAGIDESYDLLISRKGITITSSSRAGYFYGVITLWQILSSGTSSIPCLNIEDSPRFRWRGFMLDSARHIRSETFILTLLDYMAEHKLNVFHWHLTDDQGWRVEIKRYPLLTSVGAFRPQTMPPHSLESITETGPYGGFFTQDQIRRIVAYAQERNIVVVPEIEMPGHASAAIAAYPQFGSSASPLANPAVGWGVFPNLYNANEATFTFLQNVLDEVIDLFPGEYIHIGGDEALKDQWKANPSVQEKMHELSISSEDGLQSWFVGRIEKYLNSKGRKLVGWDEILEGGLAPNATVMSWHGVEGGITAAKAGHDVILSPSRPLYLNFRQSNAPDEPPGRDPVNSLESVYKFDASLPSSLTTKERAHIMGVEACLWTEYVISQDRVEHMLFPRLAALAEMAWKTPRPNDYRLFLGALPTDMKRTVAMGLDPAESVFEVQASAAPNSDGSRAQVTLDKQSELGDIRYSLDGSQVTSSSPLYSSPLTLKLPSTVTAAAFDRSTELGNAVVKSITLASSLRRDSREMDPCVPEDGIQLEQDPPRSLDRPVFRVRHDHPCWIYRNADLRLVDGFQVGVASIPYIFHPATNNTGNVEAGKPPTDQALLVRADSCSGEILASISLGPAVHKDGLTMLQTDKIVRNRGVHDLCLQMPTDDPSTVWLLNFVQPLTTINR